MIKEKKVYFKTYKIKSDIKIENTYGKFLDSFTLSQIFRQVYKDLDIDITVNESFIVLSLDTNHNIKGILLLSQGNINQTLVDFRLLGKFLFDTLGTAFVVCHNHPSGNIKFSDSDIELCKKLKNSFNQFDIKLLDSFVLTEFNYNSMYDSNLF
jgi:DNA repair protein RadC